jgi:hypothetical protein
LEWKNALNCVSPMVTSPAPSKVILRLIGLKYGRLMQQPTTGWAKAFYELYTVCWSAYPSSFLLRPIAETCALSAICLYHLNCRLWRSFR